MECDLGLLVKVKDLGRYLFMVEVNSLLWEVVIDLIFSNFDLEGCMYIIYGCVYIVLISCYVRIDWIRYGLYNILYFE